VRAYPPIALAVLPLLLASLTACPPVRENIPGAEGGSFNEPAFFVWRESPYGQSPLWAMVFVPRDENHDCNGMLAYDWSDQDQDYARLQLSLARTGEWEGDFLNSYNGCGDWYSSDRRCFDGFHYDEGGPYIVYGADTTLNIASYTEDEVRGTIEDDATGKLGFRAENCGEMPYYGYIGDNDGDERAGQPKRADDRPTGWRLRFR
jgi:hypothetical protein